MGSARCLVGEDSLGYGVVSLVVPVDRCAPAVFSHALPVANAAKHVSRVKERRSCFLWCSRYGSQVPFSWRLLWPISFCREKLDYRNNLARVAPIVRQVFVVHSVYIVGIVLLFATITFGFAPDLASGHGLGRFVAAAMALFGSVAYQSNSSITKRCCGAPIALATPPLA